MLKLSTQIIVWNKLLQRKMSELHKHTLRDNHCHESDFLPSRYHACFSVAVSLRLNLPPRSLDCRCHHFIGVVVGGYLLSYQIAVALVERDRRATDKRSAGPRKSDGAAWDICSAAKIISEDGK